MCLVLGSTLSWRTDDSVFPHLFLGHEDFVCCTIEKMGSHRFVSLISFWIFDAFFFCRLLIRSQKCLPVFSLKNRKGDDTFLEVIATLFLSLSVIPSLHAILSSSSMKRSVRETERNDSASCSCSSSYTWCSFMFLHAFCSKWVCTVLSSSFQQTQQILNHTSLMLYCSWRLDKGSEGSSCVHTRPSVLKSLSLFKLLFPFFLLVFTG